MKEKQDIPTGWALATIPDIIPFDGIFVDGDWIETKDQDPNGEIRLIQLADIGDGDFRDKSERFLTKESAYNLNCTFLKEGDILIARMPDPIGRACIFPLKGEEKFVTAVDVAIIRTGENGMLNKYLKYIINSPKIRNKIEELQTGTTRKRISRGNLGTIKLPIAPFPEQHRIVDKIDELISELEKGKEQLWLVQQKLKIYKKVLLKAAFEGKLTNNELKEGTLPKNWRIVKFNEFCKLQRGYDLPLSKTVNGKYPVITSAGINGYHNEFKANGPCLTTGRSGSVGNIHYLEIDNYWPHNTVLFVKDFCENYPKFVFYFFKQFDFKSFSASTAVPTLDRKQLYNEKVPQPKIEEQKLIVEILDKKFLECDKLEETIFQNIQQINLLKQSILEKAFSGQLVLQNPTDEPASVLLEKIKKEREEYSTQQKNIRVRVSNKIKKNKMAEELKSIIQLLHDSKKPVAAKSLWKASVHKENIDEFYAELKKLIKNGKVKEVERRGKESYLTLTDSR